MPEDFSAVARRSVRFPVLEFLILFLPIAILALVVGYSFASLRTESHIEAVLDADDTRLQHISGFIGAQVSASLLHLIALSAEDTTRRALDDPRPSNLRALESAFMTLARRNPNYQQIRWIDETGKEQLRVARDQSEPISAARNELQDKSDRYYFNTANALLSGELYISPIDLNVEHGKIEIPPRPVLRIATPAVDSRDRTRGILIINISMRYLLDAVNNLHKESRDTEYLLINHEGHLLSGQIGDLVGVAGGNEPLDFSTSHPEIWNRVLADNSGNIESWDGLWTWKRLSPLDTFKRLTRSLSSNAANIDRLTSDEFSLTLIAHRPVGFLVELRRDNRMLVSLGVILTLAIFGFSLFFYLSGHVREQRAELNAEFAMAHLSNMERMKKLEERFHRLVEASSIGQLVVDRDGRIEISNPAATRLLGYDPGELEGRSVDDLLPTSQKAQHAQYREQYLRSPEARKMGEGRELEARTKDGSRIPVEIGLNPYSDDGRQLILVSIIDLSDRGSVEKPTDEMA